MDIRYFAERSRAFAAASSRPTTTDDQAPVNNASQAAQAVQNAQVTQRAAAASTVTATPSNKDATAATEGTAQQPATLPHFSPAGRLFNALQSFEQKHPDETKQALSNIADKLRADSEHAGVFSDRLSKWADRFQQAADTGDLSSLAPRQQAHFGMRAYQQNQQPAPEADETVEHVAGVAASQVSTAPAATSGTAAASSDRTATVAAGAVGTATTATKTTSTTAPQQSTLLGDQGTSNARIDQTPPITATDRALSDQLS